MFSARFNQMRAYFIASNFLSLFKPLLGALSFKVIGAASGFALAVLISRYLGVAAAGVYYTVVASILLLSFLSSLGLPQVVMREAAVAFHKNNSTYYYSLSRVVIISLLATTLIAIIILLGGANIASELFKQPGLAIYLPWCVPAIFATVVFNLVAESLRGFQRVAYYSYLLFAGVNLIAVLILLAAYFGFSEFVGWQPLDAGVFSYVAACLVNVCIALFVLRRVLTTIKQNWKTDKKAQTAVINEPIVKTSRLFKSGISFLGYGLATQGIQWIAPLILAFYRNSDEVAIYSSALRINMLVGFILVAIASALGPRFVAYYRNGQFREFRTLYFHSQIISIAAALPLVYVIWKFSDNIMGFFGDDFISGASVLELLLVGQLVNALVGPVAQLLIAAGKEKILQNIALMNLAISCVLLLLLCNSMGSEGAAIATSAGLIFINVMVSIFGWRLLRKSVAV